MIDERKLPHSAHVDQTAPPTGHHSEGIFIPDLGNLSGYPMSRNPSLFARNPLWIPAVYRDVGSFFGASRHTDELKSSPLEDAPRRFSGFRS